MLIVASMVPCRQSKSSLNLRRQSRARTSFAWVLLSKENLEPRSLQVLNPSNHQEQHHLSTPHFASYHICNIRYAWLVDSISNKNIKHTIVNQNAPYNNSSPDRRGRVHQSTVGIVISKMQDVLNKWSWARGVVTSVVNSIRALLLRALTIWSRFTQLMAARKHLAAARTRWIILVQIFSSLQNMCPQTRGSICQSINRK